MINISEMARRIVRIPSDWRQAVEERYVYDKQFLFEAFLRNTTQKDNTARELSFLLWNYVFRRGGVDPIAILDVGTGEGTLHRKLVERLAPLFDALRLKQQLQFHLLDPKPRYVEELHRVAATLSEQYPDYHGEVIQVRWEEFVPERAYDVIICAHTIYHFPKEDFASRFEKMIEALKPNGKLYIIARRSDEVYEFIYDYYTETTGRPFNEITIEDAIPVLQDLAERRAMHMRIIDSFADVTLPFASNDVEAQNIVSFFLRKPWSNIPGNIKEDILLRFGNVDARLRQVDGIIELSANGFGLEGV